MGLQLCLYHDCILTFLQFVVSPAYIATEISEPGSAPLIGSVTGGRDWGRKQGRETFGYYNPATGSSAAASSFLTTSHVFSI